MKTSTIIYAHETTENSTDVSTDVYTTFTHYIDKVQEQRKSVSLDANGRLIESNSFQGKKYAGISQKVRITFDTFADYLKQNIDEKSFIMSGVFDGEAGSMKAVSNNDYFDSPELEIIQRNNKHFHFGESEILIVIDVDFSEGDELGYCEDKNIVPDSCKGVADLLKERLDDLSDVRMIVKQSSTSDLFHGDKRLRGSRYHAFVVAKTLKDFAFCKETMFKKMFLAGLGWIKISKAGSESVNTFFDMNMLKESQPLFVNFASIDSKAGIRREVKEIYDTKDGGYFVAGRELTSREERKYKHMVDFYKEQSKSKCSAKNDLCIKERSKKSKSSIEKAGKDLNRLLKRNEVHNNDLIKFENGDLLTVKKLLANQKEYDGKYCWDMANQGDTWKAMFNAEKDGNAANIYSFSDGGKQYNFSENFERHNKRLGDGRDSISDEEYNKLFKYMTLEDGQDLFKRNLGEVFLRKNDGIRKAFSASASFGKTEICLQSIARLFIDQFDGVEASKSFKDIRIDYFVANHDLAGEMVKRWDGIVNKLIVGRDNKEELKQRLTATHVKGRQHLCQHDAFHELEDKSKIGKTFCEGFGYSNLVDEDKLKLGGECRHFGHCEYIKQRDESSKDVVINFLAHDYLFIEMYKDKRDANILIVDEDIINSKMLDTGGVFDIKLGFSDETDDVLNNCKNGLSLYDSVQMCKADIFDLIDRYEKERSLLWSKFSKIDLKDIENIIGVKNELFKTIKALELLSTVKRGQRNVWYSESEKCLKMGQIAFFHKGITNKSMVFLDGTGSELILKKALGEDTEVVDIKVKMSDKVRVIQNVTKNYAKGDFTTKYKKKNKESNAEVKKNTDSLIDRIQRKITNGAVNDVGIITYKIVEKSIEEKTGNRCLHFGKLRGTDDYKEADKIVIIGRQKLSSEAVEEMSRLLFWDDDEEDLSFDQSCQKSYYYLKNGQHKWRWGWKYTDHRVQELLYHIEEAEMLQSMGRIRGVHTEKSKIIEIWTKEAFRIELDEVIQTGEENILDQVVEQYGILKFKNNRAEIAEKSGLDVNQFRNVMRKESDVFKILTLKVSKIGSKIKKYQDVEFFVSNALAEDEYSFYLADMGYEIA